MASLSLVYSGVVVFSSLPKTRFAVFFVLFFVHRSSRPLAVVDGGGAIFFCVRYCCMSAGVFDL